jgi:hypothetical protein
MQTLVPCKIKILAIEKTARNVARTRNTTVSRSDLVFDN